jgi:uncharacterized protein
MGVVQKARDEVDIRTYICHHITMKDRITGFDWDDGNTTKCQKHGVSIAEIEALFASDEFTVFNDDLHSEDEERFRVIGRNAGGRHIFLSFTFRKIDGLIYARVLTARYMHKKEINNYAQKTSHSED